jgi:hypothetical protein
MPDSTISATAASHITGASPIIDHLREMLEQAGFCVEEVTENLAAFLPPSRDCAVSLQIGDRISVADDGTTRLTIRSALLVGAGDDPMARMTGWRISKLFQRRAASEQFEFELDADLILASGNSLARFLSRGPDIDRHLKSLISDARATLCDRVAANAYTNEPAHPVLRIEAKFRGDLAVGRSGLIASRDARPSARHLRIMTAACDWLNDTMLPDLARAVRIAMRQAVPSLAVLDLADAPAELIDGFEVRPDRLACDPSIVPHLEPVR